MECQNVQCFWYSNVRISDPNCTGLVSDPRCVKARNSMHQFSRAKIICLDFFYFYRVEVHCPDNEGNLRVAHLAPAEDEAFHRPMAINQQPGL